MEDLEKQKAFLVKAEINKFNQDLHFSLQKKHLHHDSGTAFRACVDHYYKSGKPNATLMGALISYAEEYADNRRQASPPSMLEISENRINDLVYEWQKKTEGKEPYGTYDPISFKWGMKLAIEEMRSQCHGLIKQKAVEFADWLIEVTDTGGKYEYFNTELFTKLTTEELYEIFNQQER